mmetsp:Transcript_6672/g.11226  ORF Transcript_6672/g.11226 Transcript_6672/m.11226 type:complete len:82 (-) Transcript_6672:17-262(-)
MGEELFRDYLSMIKNPINFLMIKDRMKQKRYEAAGHFISDMNRVFDNCMEFNKRGSAPYKAASKLKKKFREQLKFRKLMTN